MDILISNVGRLVMALYLAADPLEPSRFFTHLWILLLQSGQILQVPVVWDGRWHKSEKRNQSEMTSWKIIHWYIWKINSTYLNMCKETGCFWSITAISLRQLDLYIYIYPCANISGFRGVSALTACPIKQNRMYRTEILMRSEHVLLTDEVCLQILQITVIQPVNGHRSNFPLSNLEIWTYHCAAEFNWMEFRRRTSRFKTCASSLKSVNKKPHEVVMLYLKDAFCEASCFEQLQSEIPGIYYPGDSDEYTESRTVIFEFLFQGQQMPLSYGTLNFTFSRKQQFYIWSLLYAVLSVLNLSLLKENNGITLSYDSGNLTNSQQTKWKTAPEVNKHIPVLAVQPVTGWNSPAGRQAVSHSSGSAQGTKWVTRSHSIMVRKSSNHYLIGL